MKTPLRGMALAMALIAFGGQSFAQFGGGGGMGGGGGRRGASRPDASATPRAGSESTASPSTAASKIRDTLYDLRLQLAITPEQSSLWDRFSDAVWALGGRPGMGSAMAADEQTVAQRVQQRAAQAQERAARLQAVSDALAKLYEALSPDQRHVADQNLGALIP